MKDTRFLLFWNAEGAPGGFGGSSEGADAAAYGGDSHAASTEGGSSAPGGAAFVGADGAFAEGWTSRLPDEMKEAGASLGKFKNVGDLAKSYWHLEKSLGSRPQGVIVPTEKSTPEELSAYRRAMGVPESLDGYNIAPEQLPAGLSWNAETAKPYLEAAHRHNIPPAAMKALVAVQVQQEQARAEAVATLVHKRLAEGKAELQREWGADFDKNISRAQTAARMAGVDANSAGFSDPNVVKAFVRLATMLSEDKLVTAGHGHATGPGQGAARAKDIMTNPDNPMYKRYQQGDPDAATLVANLLRQG